ncbi:hypothetical protein GC197_13720 [bacterium]|nr:hypothetical protein [bacterium]
MSIAVECLCGKRFQAKPELAGKRVKCPACGSAIDIPDAAESSATASPPPGHKRCEYCHEYIPNSEYYSHIEKHMEIREDGQQTDYATLPPEERAAMEELENAPRWYRHQKCGQVTGMPEEIIQTYLANPWFYLSDKTFCTGCNTHVRQEECVWEETGENLQVYTDRLRAAKPELRPGILMRSIVWVLNLFG